MTEKEPKSDWMYAIFNQDDIKAKKEQWTKEAEEAGMTLTEYLESIKPTPCRGNGKSMTDIVKTLALDRTIKALEQEDCEDAISRQAVNKLVDELARAISDERCYIPQRSRWTGTIMQDILNLPSVTPQPKMGHWIPVTERLPEENKTVIVSTVYRVYPEARYTKKYGWQWAYESGADYWVELIPIVTAWMPLPEQYKAESEANDGHT